MSSGTKNSLLATVRERVRTAIKSDVRRSSSSNSGQQEVDLYSSSDLRRELYSHQIFMIALSGIIGITIFATMGQFAHTAGPAGLLTAICYVGATAVCVMEGLGELAVQWPVANAMVQYVRVFVDEELAIVVGLVYWYTWSSVMATMNVGAANFSQYWGFSSTGRIIVFYIVSPICIGAINWVGVFWYGLVECVGGTLKLLFVIGGALFMIAEGATQYGSRCMIPLVMMQENILTNAGKDIDQGYQNNPVTANSHFAAVLLIIPFLTYGFLGVEIITVTAFEARDPRKSLRKPAKTIAWVISVLFLLAGVGEISNFAWNDPRVPSLQTRANVPQLGGNEPLTNIKRNVSILVMIANDAGHPRLAGFFNGCLIFSCLSAANTALYVASRVLYGLAKGVNSDPPKWAAWLGKTNRYGVPMWALIVSIGSWFWLPFLQLKEGYSVESVLSVVITIGSVGTVLVWASQCLAYIRYWHWLRLHKTDLRSLRVQEPEKWRRYDRWFSGRDRYYSAFSELQPVPAYLGLVSCFFIVFVFSTATWWNGSFNAKKLFVAYGGPLLCLIVWLTSKAINGNLRLWKRLDHNVQTLRSTVADFEEQLFLREDEIRAPSRAPISVTHGGASTTDVGDEEGRVQRVESMVQTGAHLRGGASVSTTLSV